MSRDFAEALRKRLRAAIQPSNYSIASLGRELGDKDYIRDFLIGRKESIDATAIIQIERLLSMTPGSLTADGDFEAVEPQRSVVKVMGRVGAGAEILPEVEQIPPEGLFEIEVDFPVDANSIAFEVQGDSMWPRYDAGDVVICGREGTDVNQIINWEAAVETKGGKRFLKRIKRGTKAGLFRLESHNAPPMEDIKLAWAAEVEQVVRVGKWRKMQTAKPMIRRKRAK